jgi:hypothetical protein
MIDISGQKFGKITVVGFAFKRKNVYCWNCVCDCGNTCIIQSGNLKSGHSKSCGCNKAEMISNKLGKHRGTKTSEFYSWNHMKGRCFRKTNNAYEYYGARGITVCDRWRNSFENFLEDMGMKPSKKHSIERINVNGNYEPSNCRWATISEQSRNKRSNILITDGITTMVLQDWCNKLNIHRHVLVYRKQQNTLHKIGLHIVTT